jgi:hypothetical protein
MMHSSAYEYRLAQQCVMKPVTSAPVLPSIITAITTLAVSMVNTSVLHACTALHSEVLD